MKVWITGVAGFVGRHLSAELAARGHEPVGLCLPGERPPPAVAVVEGSVTDPAALEAGLRRFEPDAVVHLAGIASVPRSWQRPVEAFDVNLTGTIRLLEAVRILRPRTRVLLVSSSHIYGAVGDGPLDEDAPHRPTTPYAIAKAAADQATLAFAARFGMDALVARPGNHVGPGQSADFVLASLALQLAAIAKGVGRPPVRAGNLESRRDFMDVRDTVRGYRLLLERGRAGRAYHLAAGRQYRISELWDSLCDMAGLRPDLEVLADAWRPADQSPVLRCDRIYEDTGWRPEIPIEVTLRDIYRDASARVDDGVGEGRAI